MAPKKSKRPITSPKNPQPAPPDLTSSVHDEPSNQPKPTTTTPIPVSVKNDSLLQENDDRIFFESLSGPQEKLANKRKYAELKKYTSWFQRIIPVRKYWKTLSVEKRRSFLEVSFHDLRAHYASEDDKLAVHVISKALSLAEDTKTLKFWACYSCDAVCNDCESHKQHVWEHLGSLVEKLSQVLTIEPDGGSVVMILSGCWKPVDLDAAIKILQNRETRQSLTTADNMINQMWPLAVDPKRAKQLESIQSMFQLLLKHKCLADIHVKTVIQRAMSELQNTATGLELLDHGLDETLACVCFLGADKLPNIFLYLHDLSKSCQLLGKDSEKTTSADDTHGVEPLASDVLEGIVLSDDSNHLILNEFFLATGTVSSKAENAALSDDGWPDWDDLLDGIFRSSPTDVEPGYWALERNCLALEILRKLKKEFGLFKSFCEEKFKHQCHMEAFGDLEDLCLEEVSKREHSVEYVAQSWEAVLRNRHKELAEIKDDPVLIDIERDAISTVLEEYQASIVTSSNEEDLRMQDNLHQVDERLVVVIRKQKQLSSKEMSRCDARIMQKLAATQQLERELEAVSIFDYREILFLLVKKFLQARLEDLAEKYAREKSDAAGEAFLTELARETKSNVNKGDGGSKQIQAKSKKKNKKKDYRRAKDVGRDKEIESHRETEEQVTTDVDQRESEFVATESVDDLKQLEDELASDERKLEENLLYQTRIENETKQKRLADKSVSSGLPKDSVGLHSGSVERTEIPGPSDQGILEDVLSPSGRQAHSQNPSTSLSQIEGCFKEQTHQWVDPHLEDNETKALGQLSAEEHDDQERFQADLAKAIQESVGPSNQGISEGGLSPSGRQAHSQNPTSLSQIEGCFKEQAHSWVDPHQEDNETKGLGQLSAEEHDEERFQADLAKAVQESLEPQKITDPALKIIAVRKYWNVLSLEKKLSLLSSVSDDDLWAHYEEDELVAHLLSEALSFRRSNKTCKFWACCLCGEKFADCKSHNQHVWVHIGNPLPKLQSVLPKEADSGWADKLLNDCWEPVDLHASMKILENRMRHESLTTAESSDVVDLHASMKILENRMRHESLTTAESSDVVSDTNGSNKECSCEFFSTIAQLLNNICLLSKRKRDFSSDDRGPKDMPEVQVVDEESKAGVVSGGDLTESGNSSGISSSDLRGDGNEHWVEAYPIPQSWPLVDDPKRAQLLDGIHGMFQLLLKHKCLADTHLKKVIHYTMDELQGLAPGLQLLDHGLDQTPACIRFLDATQLQNVLDLLQELSNSCQLGKDSEKTTSADDTHSIDTLASDVLEGTNPSNDSSHPISNEFLLTTNTNKSEYAGMGDCMKASVLSEGGLGGDAFLSWLFASSDDLEAVSWILLRENKSCWGTEILPELEKEFNHLQKLCQEKREHLCYMEVFRTLIDLCYEEFKKRHHSVEYVTQSFEALLRKRQEELVESKDNPVFINSRFERNAISLVLKGKLALNYTQCGQPGLTSHLCDLDSSNKEEYSRMLDNLHQADKSILSGIQTYGSKFSLELCRLDARIMQNLDAMQQLERELGAMSSFDYREILFCLIRPLWRALLEDLADKDAKEKADAAREL